MNIIKLLRYYILLFLILWLGACAEANFHLAEDSRLPKWFEIPQGMERNDVKVTMDTYIKNSGRVAVFKLFDKDSRKLAEVTSVYRGLYPIEEYAVKNGYPSYEVAYADGVTEVIEHKEKNNIFHVYDGELKTDILKHEFNYKKLK